MNDTTSTSSRGTTLLSRAARAWYELRLACLPPVAGFQGGAISAIAMASVTDQMVTDQHSTRLRSSSCSPPV